MKIAIVTGCLGYLGKHITYKLLSLGWKVYGVDRGSYCSDFSALQILANNDSFKFLNKDVRDLDYLPDCDVVLNTAANTHVSNSIIDSKPFIEDNVDALRHIMELIRNKPDGRQSRLVHISTDEVYGDIADGSFDEKAPLNPSNPYSASKAAGDMLIKAWARTYELEYNIIRPTNLYGGFLGFAQYPEKLIPLTIKNLDRGLKIQLHNNGDPVRTWLNVYDACEAIMTVINHGEVNEVYNVSGGVERRNREVVEAIVDAYFDYEEKYQDHVDLSYNRQGQDVRYSLDDSKLRQLGWKPEVDFETSLQEIVVAFKDNSEW